MRCRWTGSILPPASRGNRPLLSLLAFFSLCVAGKDFAYTCLHGYGGGGGRGRANSRLQDLSFDTIYGLTLFSVDNTFNLLSKIYVVFSTFADVKF